MIAMKYQKVTMATVFDILINNFVFTYCFANHNTNECEFHLELPLRVGVPCM